MYSLTTNEAPFVHYQCGCSRMFIIEEMYYCLKLVFQYPLTLNYLDATKAYVDFV